MGSAFSTRRRLLEAIAFAVQFQDMDMMREAVEERPSEALGELTIVELRS
jgi:hypothetical protein